MRRIIAVIAFALTSFAAPAHADHPPIGVGSDGKDVVEAQFILRSQGWVLPVDGHFGARTLKVVKAFQRVNGLFPDGLIGSVTWGALEQAVRVEVPAPQPSNARGLHGLPFAPDGLDLCEEMNFYRVQAGLPDRFDAIGYRESRCQNDAKSTTAIGVCCVGFWANYISSHLSSQSAYRPFIIAFCGVTGRADIYGPDPLQKQKSACVTKVVFDISGYSPWTL